MNTTRLFNTVLVVLILLLLAVPAIAQDGPAAETPTPLPDDSGEVVPAPGFNLAEFLAGLVAGATGALIGVFGIVGRIKNDKAALDAIEWLGKSIPVDALDRLNELGKAMRDAGEVIDRVTDGEPNDFPMPQRSIPIREAPGETPSA